MESALTLPFCDEDHKSVMTYQGPSGFQGPEIPLYLPNRTVLLCVVSRNELKWYQFETILKSFVANAFTRARIFHVLHLATPRQ